MEWWAFWVIGLASPIAIYALDFWEHSLGVALMLWGLVWLDRVYDRGNAGAAAVAGLLFGVAATMRTEALIYACVSVGVTCTVILARDRRPGAVIRLGLASVGGLVVPLAANSMVERMVLGSTLRAGRISDNAAVGGGLRQRASEAITTTIGLNRVPQSRDVVAGALVVTLVAVAVWKSSSTDAASRRLGLAASGAAVVVYAALAANSLGFVPGLLTASPFALAGLVLAAKVDDRRFLAIALLALPLVWRFGWTGGANPQWGARYTLTSSVLLAVTAVVALRSSRAGRIVVLAIAVAVTATGWAWLGQRSHGVARVGAHIAALNTPAVISTDAHFLREMGAFYEPHDRWLTATDRSELARAVRILSATGLRRFVLVRAAHDRAPAHLGAFQRGSVEHEAIVPGWQFTITRYRAVGT